MSPGPPPVRSEERRRRNEYPGEERISLVGRIHAPAPSKEWHPSARRWYLSLKRSAQSLYYEPSDWEMAQFCAFLMSQVANGNSNAAVIGQIVKMWDLLLVAEGSRRRARLEVARSEPEDAEAVNDIVEHYKQALGG